MPMDPIINPFLPQRQFSGFDSLAPGAQAAVREMWREQERAAKVDPLDEAIKVASKRKTDLGRYKQGVKGQQEAFLQGDGADLFERDPMSGKLMEEVGEDGAKRYVPKLGREVEALRAKSQERVGFLKGAFTSAERGDFTPEALEAQAKLGEVEKAWRLKQEKFDRMRGELSRIEEAERENDTALGELSKKRMGWAVAAESPPNLERPSEGSENAQRLTSNVERPSVSAAVESSAEAAKMAAVPEKVTTLEMARLAKQVEKAQGAGDAARIEVLSAQLREGMGQLAPELQERVKKNAGGEGFWEGLWRGTKDTAVSFAAGSNALLKMAGDLYGLATGEMDNWASQQGEYGQQYWQDRKSPELQVLEQERAQKMAEAPDELGKAWAYVRATVTSPALVASMIGEQLPNLVGTGGAGAAARVGAEKLLLSKISGEATETAVKIAAERAAKIGVSTAVGTGAVMQGADVGGDQHQDLVAQLANMPEEQARAIPEVAELLARGSSLDEAKITYALLNARKVALGASLISVAAQNLPGAKTLEKMMVGGAARTAGKTAGEAAKAASGSTLRKIAGGVAAGMAGEGISEAVEEGGGKVLQNVAAQPVDPNREWSEGLGETVAQAGLVGAVMGGPGGAVNAAAAANIEHPTPKAEHPSVSAAVESSKQAETLNAEHSTSNTEQTEAAKMAAVPGENTEPGAEGVEESVPQQAFRFEDAQGNEQVVTGSGIRDAMTRLPEGFTPDMRKTRPVETPAQSAGQTQGSMEGSEISERSESNVERPSEVASNTEQVEALQGEKIDKEWTEFAEGSGSLKIPRAEMPQIKAEARGALANFLKARGVESTQEEVLPGELKPTQAEYSQGKVDKARKFEGGDRAILVSADGHVVDGHHQWMAKLTDKPDEPMRIIRLDAPIREIIEQVKEMPSVETEGGGGARREKTPLPIIQKGENKPAHFVKMLTRAVGLKGSDKASRFLMDFAPRLHKANAEAFEQMEVHVLTNKQWASAETGRATPDSVAAYNPQTNTLYVNTDRVKGDAIVEAVLHEAGHFTEKFALGTEFAQGQWELLSDAQREAAAREYDASDVRRGADLKGDVRARSEWVAFQFARVVRGDTEQMNPQMRTKLQRFLTAVRELVRKWYSKSNDITTADLDRRILEVMGFDAEGRKSKKEPARQGAVPSIPTEGAAESPVAQVAASKVESAKAVKKGKRISVGVPADGNPDLLNMIEDMGGIASRTQSKHKGGELDGLPEAFSRGAARLLVRKNGGRTVDQLMQELEPVGYRFDTPDAFYAAVEKSISARAAIRKRMGLEEYGAKFTRAFLQNEHPRKWLRANQPITASDLAIGDEFTVDGEKFHVMDIDEDGNVTVKDGITQTLEPGALIYPDKGKVKKTKKGSVVVTFPQARPRQDEMFGGDEMPFNLASEEQHDGARLLQDRLAREDAVRDADKRQTKIAEAESSPKRSMFDESLKKQARDAFDGLLGSPTVDEFTENIPADRAGKFLPLAQAMVAQGVNTPEKVAAFLDETFGVGKARKFSQSLWNFLSFADTSLTGRQNWEAVYRAIDKAPMRGAEQAEGEKMEAIVVEVKGRMLAAVRKDGEAMTRKDLDALAKGVELTPKQVDEAVETGIVEAARELAATSKGNAVETFDQMVKLYEKQPNLTAKTSTSKINQAYSTPAPMAYLVSQLADVKGGRVVVEPTAGNGMLLLEADPKVTKANEIDPTRRANLERGGFEVTALDATMDAYAESLGVVDRIVMNPPFGAVKGDGKSKQFSLHVEEAPQLETTSVDQSIVMNTLRALGPDGRATLIIGSGAGKAVDVDARKKGYMSGSKQSFFYYLYRQFKVTDHFTVSGDLYAKQGAGWPVDIITIDGRGQAAIPFPWINLPQIFENWNELRGKLTDRSRAASDSLAGSEGVVSRQGVEAGLGSSVSGSRGERGRSARRVSEHAQRLQPGSGIGSNVEGAVHERAGRPAGSQPVDVRQPAGREGGDEAGFEAAGRGSGAGGGLSGDTQSAATSVNPIPVETNATGLQAVYVPRSNAPQATAALTPVNLVTPTARALQAVEARRGSLDKFVSQELGYKSEDELYQHFDAGQIDAIALGIDNVMRGGALITGDQTGMGKGRTVAGMIRYAVRQGIVPVFVTKNPALYADMLRDLEDIGSGHIKPFLTNSNERVVLEDRNGNVMREVRSFSPKKQQEMVDAAIATGVLPDGAKVIFTTYDQIKSDWPKGFKELPKEARNRKGKRHPKPDGQRMRFLRKFARDGFVVLDEAHLAGGESDTGWRVTQAISGRDEKWNELGASARPRGIYYSSATYAKAPKNMGVYFETNVKRAVSGPKELAEMMEKGGVPLQQVMASMLAQDGQYIRRELDFTGIEFKTRMTNVRENGSVDTERAEHEKRLADSYTEPLREVIGFNKSVLKMVEMLNEQLQNEGIKTEDGKTLADQLSGINFGDQLHNMVRQYLLAIKADGIADEAIHALKAGKSPVIAIHNTMESVLGDLMAAGYSADFDGLLRRYLDKAMELTIKKPNGDKQAIRIDLENLERSFPNVGDIPQGVRQAAARLVRERKVIEEMIAQESGRGDIPVSPIDRIRERIEDAGFSFGEISGRKNYLTRDGKVEKRNAEDATKAGQNKILAKFNRDGKMALLLTVSGSTGISAHASEKFKNQQPRVMIVGQILPDINDMIQMFGRVFRKGQVSKPEYSILNTTIPAEMRLSAILSLKLASLNANTTSAGEGVNTGAAGGMDFLNKYGDEVIYQYLADHPEIVASMVNTFPNGELPTLESLSDGEWYGSGDFARSVTGEVAVLTYEEQRAFYERVLEEYEAKIAFLDEIGENDLRAQNLPLEADTLEKRVLFKSEGDSVFDSEAWLETVKAKSSRKPLDAAELPEMAKANRDRVREDFKAFRSGAKTLMETEQKDLEAKHGGKANWEDIRQKNAMRNVKAQSQIEKAFGLFGKPVLYTTGDGSTAIGFVTDVLFDKAKPLTPSAHKLVTHINTEQQKVTLPMSQIEKLEGFSGYGWQDNYTNLANVAAIKRIVTGNLIGGYNSIEKMGAGGRVVTYTTSDGQVLTGILMPNRFNPGAAISNVNDGPGLVKALRDGQDVTSAQGAEFLWRDGGIEIRVPASKSAGGKYWQDQRLLRLIDGGEMRQVGNQMAGRVAERQAGSLVDFFNKGISDQLAYFEQSKRDAEALSEVKKTEVLGSPAGGALRTEHEMAKTVTPVIVQGRELAEMESGEVKRYIKERFTGEWPNLDTRWNIGISDEGSRHSASQNRGMRRVPLRDLDKLIRNAVWLGRDAYDGPKKGIRWQHRFYVPVEVNGEPWLAKLRVNETLAGEKLYDVRSSEMTKLAKDGSAVAEPTGSKSPVASFPANVQELADAVKSVWPDDAVSLEKPRNERRAKYGPVADFEAGGESDVLGTPAVKGTEEQETILNKVTGTLEDKRTLGRRVLDYLSDLRDYIAGEWRQSLLDRFASIKHLERQVLGTNDIDASVSAYKQARLTGNLASVMEYLLRHGRLAYRNGSMTRMEGKGLSEILSPIVKAGKLRLFEGYVAAKRADRLLAEGREKNFGKFLNEQTGEWEWSETRAREEIDAMLALGKEHPEFEAARQEYVDFQRSVLDVAQSAGLIDPKKRALWEKSDYVPFYRIVETLDEVKGGAKGPSKRRGFSGQQSGIRRLSGGPQQVAILENMVRNVESLMDASFKNIAMQRIADLADQNSELMVKIPYKAAPFRTSFDETVSALESAGVDTSALTRPELEEMVTFWRMRAPEGKDVVSVMRGGKTQYYRVKDKALLRAIIGMGPREYSWWMRVLMMPKHALTSLVTLDPAFMASNVIRDSVQAWAIADSPIKPGIDSLRGLAKGLRESDPSKLAIMAAGGGSGHYNRLREGEVRKAFLRMSRAERENFKASIVDTPAKLWRFYQDIGRASENANRIAIYDSARKRGASEAEAAFQALDIMDFGLRGDSKLLGFFLDTVPFMNARIQGLYKLGRVAVENPKRVATYGAVITAATMALLAANWDNDDYWALPEWERDLYYHLWIGGRHVRIPKPFEVGQVFSTMPERMAEVIGKTGDGDLFMDRVLAMLAETFAMNPTPQVLKPALDVAMNRNSLTGNRIVSQGDEFKRPEQQYNARTSTLAREIAELAPAIAPDWMRSPKQLEYLIRGYFGAIGGYVMESSNALLRAWGDYPERLEAKSGELPFVRRFLPEDDLKASKYVSQFYEMSREVEGMARRIKELRAQGDVNEATRLQQENQAMLAYRTRVQSADKQMKAFGKQERSIYEGTGGNPEERRRRLAELTARRNQVAQQAVESAPGRPRPFMNVFQMW